MKPESTIHWMPPVSIGLFLGLAALALGVFLLSRWTLGPPAKVARRRGLVMLRASIVATLIGLFANPVLVSELPGHAERPEVFFLLDASQSMALGAPRTRWQDVARTLGETESLLGKSAPVRINLFRFGHRLAAIESPEQVALGPASPTAGMPSNGSPSASGATDWDTLLVPALRQVSSRFGRSPPAAIVLFSDGQVRDAAEVESAAAHFVRLGIPIHVVPVGDPSKGGDVALVGVIAPERTRKFSQVEIQVFLRSYGYEGRRTELELSALGGAGQPPRKLASAPVVLRAGVQSVSLSFQSDLETRKLLVSLPAAEDEISVGNNVFPIEVMVDRTKVRVLYIEGSQARPRAVLRGEEYEWRGPYSDLQEALAADPDIECVVVAPAPGTGVLRRVAGGPSASRAFPETIAELFAFDALVLSDVAGDEFTTEQLEWIEAWIGKRGGGLCMLGGPASFAAGGWGSTGLERVIPVEMSMPEDDDWNFEHEVAITPLPAALTHPIWRIVADEKKNREILERIPAFSGLNQGLRAKPNLATVLATARHAGQPSGPAPAIVVSQVGNGRAMAMATALTAPWAREVIQTWGEEDGRYYAKFWRNAIYWLTERSSIGRRRLSAATDKRFYRPGDTLTLEAATYDESANLTTDYHVVALVEPQTRLLDANEVYSPIHWPSGLKRTSGDDGPFLAWGEEFELPRRADRSGYALSLPLAEALATGSASQSLRMELTAYEDSTQVDSMSLGIQLLHDPYEQQNPAPNHALLDRIASVSGGKVLRTPVELAAAIAELPVKSGPPQFRRVPLWSNWPLAGLLLLLLSVEWIWRRNLGLA